jgi:secretion/DNA translocation related CpaE-like protein
MLAPQGGSSRGWLPASGRDGYLSADVVTTGRPLLLTCDPDLLDEVVRAATAAGTELDVCPDPVAARAQWTAAPLVLAGADQLDALSRAAFPRRPGVVAVSRDPDDHGVWQRALEAGAEYAAVLPDGEAWLVARIADAIDAATHCAVMVATVGGRGGAGASTLAAALAVTAKRRALSTILVDLDPFGGGIDLLFGGEHALGLRWPDLARSTGRIFGAVLRESLPQISGLAVLSWARGAPDEPPPPIGPEATKNVVRALARSADVVVFDLPRRIDPAAESVLPVLDVGLLVVPAEVRAAAAAARVAGFLAARVADLRVVERGPAPGGLAAGDVAASLGLPFAGYLRPEPGLAADLERGDPPAGRGSGPLARFCADFLAAVAPSAGRWRR